MGIMPVKGRLFMENNDLIYLVSCAVNETAPEKSRVNGMDLDLLFREASWHMLVSAAAAALEAAGVRDERFRKSKGQSVLKNARQDMEMEMVFAEMQAAGIWYLPLKGIVLQHLYPAYCMRQMADHDILFDAERAADVRAIMERLGFSVVSYDFGCHDTYHKLPVSNFEMHRTLFSPTKDESLYLYYRDVKKRLIGDGCEKRFSPEDFYLYVTAQTA